MTICTRCVLDESFPGIAFDEDGVCNFCREYKGTDQAQALKQKFENKFMKLVEKLKGKSTYDCLLAYSGGKDSTYTLYLLKQKYGLSVLALSYDNWFQSERAARNIRAVVQHLDVDHLTIRPRFSIFRDMMQTVVSGDVYPIKAMQRASSVCTTCISLIRFACFKVAVEKEIPFVVFGMSPGQAPVITSVVKTNSEMVREMQGAIYRPLAAAMGDAIRPCFLEERHFEKAGSFPYSINPLRFSEYEEGMVLKTIEGLGWISPDDTDANSTNCLLNSFANVSHIKRFGFNPYAFELAGLVREGYLDRTTALEKLGQPENAEAVVMARQMLGIT